MFKEQGVVGEDNMFYQTKSEAVKTETNTFSKTTTFVPKSFTLTNMLSYFSDGESDSTKSSFGSTNGSISSNLSDCKKSSDLKMKDFEGL